MYKFNETTLMKMYSQFFFYKNKELMKDGIVYIPNSPIGTRLILNSYENYPYPSFPNIKIKNAWQEMYEILTVAARKNNIGSLLPIEFKVFDTFFQALMELDFDLDKKSDCNQLMLLFAASDYPSKEIKGLLNVSAVKVGQIVFDFFENSDLEKRNLFSEWISGNSLLMDLFFDYCAKNVSWSNQSVVQVVNELSRGFSCCLHTIVCLKSFSKGVFEYLKARNASQDDYEQCFNVVKDLIEKHQKHKVFPFLESLMAEAGYNQIEDENSTVDSSPVRKSDFWQMQEYCKNFTIDKKTFAKFFNFSQKNLINLEKDFAIAGESFGNSILCKNLPLFKNTKFGVFIQEDVHETQKLHFMSNDSFEKFQEQLLFLEELMNCFFNNLANLSKSDILSCKFFELFMHSLDMKESYQKMLHINRVLDKNLHEEMSVDMDVEFKL